MFSTPFLSSLKFCLFGISLLSFPANAQNEAVEKSTSILPPMEGTQLERVGVSPLPVTPSITQPEPFLPSATISKTRIHKAPLDSENTWNKAFIPGKLVYLNGTNISSIRDQDLSNVDIKIDSDGNIFIEAPQYEVNLEERYHPLLPEELPRREKKLPSLNEVFDKSEIKTKTLSATETNPSK